MLQKCGKLLSSEEELIQLNDKLVRRGLSHLRAKERRRFTVVTEVDHQHNL